MTDLCVSPDEVFERRAGTVRRLVRNSRIPSAVDDIRCPHEAAAALGALLTFCWLGTLAGGIVFNEFGNYSALQAGMLPLGSCINFFGIWLLTQRPKGLVCCQPELLTRCDCTEEEVDQATGVVVKEADGLTTDGTKNVLVRHSLCRAVEKS